MDTTTPPNWKEQFEKWLPLAGGSLLLFGAILVLFGWYTGHRGLIQVGSEYAAMQYNTALSIGLCGGGLVCLGLNRLLFLRILALLAFLINFLTVIEYFFEVNLGVDQLFFTYNLEYPMEFPGRMALNSATALSLSSLSLFLLSFKEYKPGVVLSLVFGSLIISIGGVSFFGYLTGVEAATGWSDFSRMAIHTAVSCVLLGSTLLGYATLISLETRIEVTALPISISIGLLASTIATWQAFRAQDYSSIFKIASQDLSYLKATVEEKIVEEIWAIERIAQRWDALASYPPKLWEVDTKNYLNDLRGLDSLQAYDSALKKQYDSTKPLVVSPLPPESLSPEALAQLRLGKPIFIPSLNKKGMIFFSPLMISHEFKGALVSQMNIATIVKETISDLELGSYLISLFFGDESVFTGGSLNSPIVGQPISVNFNEKYVSFSLRLYMTEKVFLAQRNSMGGVIFSAGFIITILAGLLVYFGQKIRIRKKALEVLNAELLEASKRADAASIAKGVFLATMSHEIRTPLNAILGTVQLLQETEVSEGQRKYLDRIINAGKMLLALIADVLDFSKIEAGGVALELVSCELPVLMKNIADTLYMRAKEKKIDIFLDCPSQPLPPLMMDPTRFQQILTNLGNNALKFTKEGSIIYKISLKGKKGNLIFLRFEIIDTGIGIAKEDLSKLFQRFSQLEPSRHVRQYGGVGLGLSICKKLVELMHGEIGVSSDLGVGSTFWVEIPFAAASSEEPARYSLQGKTVFLSVSNEVERQIFERYFKDWGAQVKLQDDGAPCDLALIGSAEEALKFAEAKKIPTIIVADKEIAPLPQGIKASLVRPVSAFELYKSVK